MAEYSVDPEVAGGLGPSSILDTSQHPPAVSKLHYEFAGWLGDDIVETFPCFIVTENLAGAIDAAGLTGVEFDEVTVTKDPQFERFFSDVAKSLPTWRWLRAVGKPHLSEVWQQSNGVLVVSDRVMDLLHRFKIQALRRSSDLGRT